MRLGTTHITFEPLNVRSREMYGSEGFEGKEIQINRFKKSNLFSSCRNQLHLSELKLLSLNWTSFQISYVLNFLNFSLKSELFFMFFFSTKLFNFCHTFSIGERSAELGGHCKNWILFSDNQWFFAFDDVCVLLRLVVVSILHIKHQHEGQIQLYFGSSFGFRLWLLRLRFPNKWIVWSNFETAFVGLGHFFDDHTCTLCKKRVLLHQTWIYRIHNVLCFAPLHQVHQERFPAGSVTH